MTTLYTIAQEYREAADKLANLDLDEQTIADTLESLQGDIHAKAIATAAVIRNMDSFAEQIKQAEDAMKERRQRLEKRTESLMRYLLESMQHVGIKTAESPELALRIKSNPPSVKIEDESLIPDEFKTKPEPPKPVPDKSAIKRALAAGQVIAGASLQQGSRVEIK